ncbi:MAG: signal peptidase [Pirellulales bacterium]|nr:signal peptidase [Pirellulales bacterium]
MRLLGAFAAPAEKVWTRGMRVIARTGRGLEAGEVLCEATDDVIGRVDGALDGQILREMTPDDVREIGRIGDQQSEHFATCQKCIDKLGLKMQLVDVEHIFGGERIVVYYLADGRVDFRELVRMLAGEFQTRIEMRQIGVRDEAKLLADFGDCGKPVCCNSHLSQMPPVSMKMAKLQKATLDPTKISGRCGRLKCCLRYEYEVYEQLQKRLPPIGARVQTPHGSGRIVGQEILAGQLLVEMDDRVRKLVDVGDIAAPAADEPPPARPEEQSATSS